MDYIVAQLANGVAVGSVYGLLAVGFGLVYSVLFLMNLAHGDVLMAGTLGSLALVGAGLPLPVALLAGGAIGMLLALGVERAAYRPVRDASRLVPMISALGAGLVLTSVAQLAFGPETMLFPPLLPEGLLRLGPVALPAKSIAIAAIAAVCAGAGGVWLRHSRAGRALRCLSQDPLAARLVGIPVERMIAMTYAAGGLAGVLGGLLYAGYFGAASVQMGLAVTMKAWAAVMLGGLGSLGGAMLGGLLLGIAEAVAVMTLGSAWRDAAGLGLVVLMLLARPTGLMGHGFGVRS